MFDTCCTISKRKRLLLIQSSSFDLDPFIKTTRGRREQPTNYRQKKPEIRLYKE